MSSTLTTTRTAPWTLKEVENLLEWQSSGMVHEFTSSSGSSLIPTISGWIEVEGGPVVQDWAHCFMLDGSYLTQLKKNWSNVPND